MFDIIRIVVDFAAFYAIYLMLSVSLELEYGETGISNFGKAMFFAAGAFTAGALVIRLAGPIAGLIISESELKLRSVYYSTLVSRYFAAHPGVALAILFLMLILGALFGAVLGYLASYPAIRLREDYLGITLIAASELVRVIGRNYDPLIGGTLGTAVPDPFAWLMGRQREIVVSTFMMIIALTSFIVTASLSRSPFGRLLRAVRDSETAAEALGKDVVKVRMKSLMIGSAIAGAAGVLYAFYMGFVHADDFNPIKTFIVWVMVIIGGSGNIWGAAIGTFVYLLIDRGIALVKHQFTLPFDINYVSYAVLGTLLVAVLMFRPEGLLPEKPLSTIPRKILKMRVKAQK